ncbi:Uncharacterised protein [uncultured archaeon]|nr:Uncharacterised protein [uncultured archaeon]
MNEYKINPSMVQLYARGKKVNQPEALSLINSGLRVPSSRQIGEVLKDDISKFPRAVKGELFDWKLLTRSLNVKNAEGVKLGEKIVFSDEQCSVTFMVNKVFQGEYGLIANLKQGNFGLEMSKDGNHATIYELKENDAIVGGIQLERYAYQQIACLVGRGLFDMGHLSFMGARRLIHVSQPSEKVRMLEYTGPVI